MDTPITGNPCGCVHVGPGVATGLRTRCPLIDHALFAFVQASVASGARTIKYVVCQCSLAFDRWYAIEAVTRNCGKVALTGWPFDASRPIERRVSVLVRLDRVHVVRFPLFLVHFDLLGVCS